MIENAYNILFLVALIVIAIAIILIIIKAFMGPKTADRIICINSISTLVVAAISILAFYLKETFILDVSLIYVLIGSVGVMVLITTFINAYIKKHHKEKK